VNPIDTKVRSKVYDDYPDYYDHVPQPRPKPYEAGYQIMGYDGAGTIAAIGDSVTDFHVGDAVYYSGSPIRPGSNAEYQLVDSRSMAPKPPSLSFVEAAAMPLTWITAYEALVERLAITPNENAGLLIINGAGGVGSVATQIARTILKLPVVVTTASRPETESFSREMGATHVVNHRGDIVSQIADLDLKVPIKYVFITHSTTPYLDPVSRICEPFGKVCSIVQTKDMSPMYGSQFMAKSLVFVWELLGTKPWFGTDVESHGRMLRELAELVEKGEIKCHLKNTLRLDLKGLRRGHELVESGKTIGKNALSVDFGEGGAAFT